MNFSLSAFSLQAAIIKQELKSSWVIDNRRWNLYLRNVKHDLSLTVLVAGTIKIILTRLSTYDTNSF